MLWLISLPDPPMKILIGPAGLKVMRGVLNNSEKMTPVQGIEITTSNLCLEAINSFTPGKMFKI